MPFKLIIIFIATLVTVKFNRSSVEGRHAMGTDIVNNVQQTEQELPPQDQILAKEMTTTVGKSNMTNFENVGKRVIEQRTAVSALLVENLTTLSKTSLGIKGRNKPT